MKYFFVVPGSLLAAALVGWLVGGIELCVVITALVWIFYGISRIPKVGARVPLYSVVLFILIVSWYKGWFKGHMPLTSKSLQTLPARMDISMAKATFDPGVSQDSSVVEARNLIDSLHNEAFQRALGMLTESVRQRLITPDSALKILNDSLANSLDSYKAAQARRAFQQAAQVRSAVHEGEQNQDKNKVYLVVDVANEDGTTYKIPRGMTAEVSIDSAWYTCNIERITSADSRWGDGNGYSIAPNRSEGDRECVNRFLNKNENIGCVLIFDEQNPKGSRLAMGQTIVVNGGKIKIAVNDWVSGIFGGEGGSFALTQRYIDGGFYDNRGFLRVLIVLKRKF